MKIITDSNNYVIGIFTDDICNEGVHVEDSDVTQDILQYNECYKLIKGIFVLDEQRYKQVQNQEALFIEREQIKQWFEDTDYIVLKVFRGNWDKTDPRYVSYLSEYDEKHTRLGEIENILGGDVDG